jgi:hypothetical protein
MGYIKGKGKRLEEEVRQNTITCRQRMLDFFNRDGGATFPQMCDCLDKNASHEMFNYHFYALREGGYLRQVGILREPGKRGLKIWVALRETYEYEHTLPKNKKIKEDKEELQTEPPKYVNGVMTVRMQHPTRVRHRVGKVHIGSTMGMF